MSSDAEQYLVKARERLAAAEVLTRSRKFDDSVSRAYYAVLLAARSLLATRGLHPTSHSGTVMLFGKHFVRTGLVHKDLGIGFAKLNRLREDTEYSPSIHVEPEVARWSVTFAMDFLTRVAQLVRRTR